MPLLHHANVKNLNKETIDDLRRKLKLADGKRKACYEEGESIKRCNQDLVDNLQDDLKLLEGKLREISRQPKYPLSTLDTGEATFLGRKKTKEVIEILDGQVGDLRKQVDRLRHERARKDQKLNQLRKQRDELQGLANVGKSDGKYMLDNRNKQTSLENQIQGILMKTVEATHIQKKYSTMISALSQEESNLEMLIKETEAEIQNKANEMVNLREVWNKAYQSEKQIQAELRNCEQFLAQMKKDFERRQNTLRTKVTEIRNEGNLEESENLEEKSPRAWSSPVSRSLTTKDTFAEKLRRYEEMNGRIKSQTGLENIKELLAVVNEITEANERLQNMETELREKISQLEAEKRKLQSTSSHPKYSRQRIYMNLEGNSITSATTRSEDGWGSQTQDSAEELSSVQAALRLLCVKLATAFHQPSTPPSEDAVDLAVLCMDKLENLVDFCSEYNQDDIVKALESLQLRESIDDTRALLKTKKRSESLEQVEETMTEENSCEVSDDREILTRIMVKKMAKQVTDFHAKKQQKDSMKRK